MIQQHPVISGIIGSCTTAIVGMINIDLIEKDLQFATIVIKFIGVTAGAIVAVASLYYYFKNGKHKS